MGPPCYSSSSATVRLGGQSPVEYQPVITSPSGHPNKDGRTRDSSSALMRVHQSCKPVNNKQDAQSVCVAKALTWS